MRNVHVHVHVCGPLCVLVESADAAQNLAVEFEEDTVQPQQAIVSLSWDRPSG